MRSRICVGAWLTALLAAGIGIFASPANGDTETVPLRGTIVAVTSLVEPAPDGCEVFLDSSHTGELTHLGEFTGSGTTCAFNGRVVDTPPFDPGGGAPYVVADFVNQMTYTAANGDQLFLRTDGSRVESLVDGSNHVIGTTTVLGGTGRFVGATGAATNDDPPNTDYIHIDGWIAYDASHAAP